MPFHHLGIQPRRVEDVTVVGQPHGAVGIFNILCQLLPGLGALALMNQLLAVVIHPVQGRGDHPAMTAHAPDKMLAGTFENVVGRFMPGHVFRKFGPRLSRQGNKAHKRMQVMGLAADLLDASLQLAAQLVPRQHRSAITVADPPQHFIQQAPALITVITGGRLQQLQQRLGNPCLEGPQPWRDRLIGSEQVSCLCLAPAHLAGVDLMAEQPARLFAPGAEQVVAFQTDHPHSPICCGCGRSRNCSRSNTLVLSACCGW